MNIAELLGMSKLDVESRFSSSVVASNNVNCTVELKDVEIPYDSYKHHCFLYFDIVDRAGMVMALVKMENVPFITRVRMKLFNKIRCKEYIGSVTVTSDKSILISYVQEQLVKAL